MRIKLLRPWRYHGVNDVLDVPVSTAETLVQHGIADYLEPRPQETPVAGPSEVKEPEPEPDPELDEPDDDLSDMTVAELKERLAELGLPVSGKKAELIDRLRDAG